MDETNPNPNPNPNQSGFFVSPGGRGPAETYPEGGSRGDRKHRGQKNTVAASICEENETE